MNYTGNTNWGLTDTVNPTDMNRIEQGITDAKTDLANKLNMDGSNNASGILSYGATNNFVSDLSIPDLKTVRQQTYTPNFINSGSIDTSGNPALLASSLTTQVVPWSTPQFTGNSANGFTVVSGDWICFNTSYTYLLNGHNDNGTITLPSKAYVNAVIMGGQNGLNGYYIGRGQAITFYLNGAQVYQMYVDPLGQNGQTLTIPDTLCDTIAISGSWGSAWGGDGGSDACPGKQFTGYQINSVPSANASLPVSGKDLSVSFVNNSPVDDYGVNQYTITGTPTFTSNKYNNTTLNTYLTYPNFTSMGTSSWCVQGLFNFNSTSVQMQILSSLNTSGFLIGKNTANKLTLWLDTTNTGIWNISNGSSGIKSDWSTSVNYYIRLRFTGSQYLLDWSLDDITITSSSIINQIQTGILFGAYGGQLTSLNLLGTMTNLAITVGSPTIVVKSTSGALSPYYGKDLYVDFLDAMPNDRYGLHPVTVGGLPNFANGMYNRVGTSYLQYPFTTMGTNAWCMQAKVIFGNLNTLQLLFKSASQYGITLYTNTSNYLTLALSSNGSSWDIANVYSANVKNNWVIGTAYYIRLRFTGSQYLVDWSLDGNSWINEITINSNVVTYQTLTNIKFGIDWDSVSNVWQGSIGNMAITVGSPNIVLRSIYKTVKFNVTSPVSYTNTLRQRTTLTTISDANVNNKPPNSVNQIFIDSDGSSETIPMTLTGKDILLKFENNANACYDSYNNTVLSNGNPVVQNGKLFLDGKSTGSCLYIPNYRWDTSRPWTMEGRYTFYQGGCYNTIFSTPNPSYGMFLLRRGSDNKMHCWVSTNGSSWNIWSEAIGTHVLNAYTEYHICFTFTGTSYNVYVNGELDMTIATSSFYGVCNTTMWIGTESDGITYPFIGTLDDFRFTQGICRYNTNFYPPAVNTLNPDRFVYKETKMDLTQDYLWDGCIVQQRAVEPMTQYRRQDLIPATFCAQSGNTNYYGAPDLISAVGKVITTKVGGSYSNLKLTDGNNNQFTISTASTLDCTSYLDGIYTLNIDSSGNLTTTALGTSGRSVYINFDNGTPNDIYTGLVPTVVNPSTIIYSNNKAYMNGNHLIYIPYTQLPAYNAWCIQAKMSFANTTSSMDLFTNYQSGNYSVEFGRGTNNKLYLYAGNANNTAWGIANNIQGTKSDWAVNQEYYIRLRFTGTQYLVDWSNDNITWTNDITVNSSTFISWMNSGWNFGGNYGATGGLIGTIDEIQYTLGQPTCVKRPHIFKQTTQPTTYQNGTIWVNTTKGSQAVTQYNGTTWVPYSSVPIGEFGIENGYLVNYRTYPYFSVGFPISNSTWATCKKVPAGKLITNYAGVINNVIQPYYNWVERDRIAPHYQEYIPLAWATTYTATQNGWLDVNPYSNSAWSYYYINGMNVLQAYGYSTGVSNTLFKVSVGDTYYGTGQAGSVYFIPEKGLNYGTYIY